MTRVSNLCSLFCTMALLQKQIGVRCYVHAHRSTRRVGTSDPLWSPFLSKINYSVVVRGGDSRVHFSSLSATANDVKVGMDDKAFLQQKAQESLSIAGSQQTKDFGGLQYRESGKEYRVVFVLGGPGAGKGTQSDLLLKNYPCAHFSAGELLRAETTKEGSQHAQLIEKCLVEGNIVPVEISLALLENAMRETPGKQVIMLVDGFPRNFDNLDGWARCMSEVAAVWGVLYFQCPLSVLEERILERAKESGRSDDNIESLRRRFKTFEGDTCPVIDALRLVGKDTPLKVFDIHGNQPVEAVWKETQGVMNSFVSNDVLSANARLIEAVSTNDVEKYRELCAPEMFNTESAERVMLVQENVEEFPGDQVNDACVNIITGTKVVVTYTRRSRSGSCRESRVWSHDGDGWRNIHFARFLDARV